MPAWDHGCAACLGSIWVEVWRSGGWRGAFRDSARSPTCAPMRTSPGSWRSGALPARPSARSHRGSGMRRGKRRLKASELCVSYQRSAAWRRPATRPPPPTKHTCRETHTHTLPSHACRATPPLDLSDLRSSSLWFLFLRARGPVVGGNYNFTSVGDVCTSMATSRAPEARVWDLLFSELVELHQPNPCPKSHLSVVSFSGPFGGLPRHEASLGPREARMRCASVVDRGVRLRTYTSCPPEGRPRHPWAARTA